MSAKLLTEQPLEFLSLKGDWTGSSESTLFKMPHCWKSCPGSFIINSRKRVSSPYQNSRRNPPGIQAVSKQKVTDSRKSRRNTPGHVFFSKSRRTLCL